MKYRISRSKTNRIILRYLGIEYSERHDGIYFTSSVDQLPRVASALKELGIARDDDEAHRLAWSFFLHPMEGVER
jgi:hypothetical protein